MKGCTEVLSKDIIEASTTNESRFDLEDEIFCLNPDDVQTDMLKTDVEGRLIQVVFEDCFLNTSTNLNCMMPD